ncbi:MAG: S8 family serine peptidase [Deltaproteobacteria bacterium]|nr:S8 family serine peptidase [Deltaproteobacteria bacterium]
MLNALMKLCLAIITSLFILTLPTLAFSQDYVQGEILVKFKVAASSTNRASLNTSLGSNILRNLGPIGVQQLKVRPGLSVQDAIKEYQSRPEVEYVQPNYIYHLQSTTPNDPDYPSLWGLDNTGQTVSGIFGTSDADIDAPEAWDITTGSPSVIVAVVDSGVDYNHPDISGNIWSNSGEVINGIDSDLNGYVDDVRGWDFVDNDNDPMDVNSHGTHVSGTIGAVGNNGIGITGVAWTTKIMPVRVFDFAGLATTANIVLGFDYAVANGAKIINFSAGGGPSDQAMMDSISAANNAEVLMVFAAGNSANNNDAGGAHFYPSDYTYDNIISVSATDQDDSLASFSNYGATSVDVGAPGTNIYSLKPARQTIFWEDFEGSVPGWITNTVSGYTWGITSDYYYSGSKSLDDGSGVLDYLANTDSWVASPTFNLSGKSGCTLSLQTSYIIENSYDYIHLMISTGGTYSDLAGTPLSGSRPTWVKRTYDLKYYEGNASVSLMFGLTSDATVQYGGVNFDDISVTCSSTTFSGTEYTFKQGTSMAAPHVVGLAALLLAQNPSLTVSQLKALILENGDSLPALSGKTTTGKRINAYNSLRAGDITAPTNPYILIDGGSSNTTSTGVTLALSAADGIGVTGYYISETSSAPAPGSFTSITSTTDYSANVPFVLSSGSGTKTVYAWFKDTAENISSGASDTIIYTAEENEATGGSDGCFIATAVYGSYEAPVVKLLRRFRDQFLLTNGPGRLFVDAYYRYSPSVAEWLKDSNWAKPIVRVLLLPLIALAWFLVKLSLPVQILAIILLLGIVVSITRLRRRADPPPSSAHFLP